jgi:hypothetical protein
MNDILILCDERDKKQQSMLTNMVRSLISAIGGQEGQSVSGRDAWAHV